jgi:hypothetical protein
MYYAAFSAWRASREGESEPRTTGWSTETIAAAVRAGAIREPQDEPKRPEGTTGDRTWVPVYVERAICDLIPDEFHQREIARDAWAWDDAHPDAKNALNHWQNEAIRQRVELIALQELIAREANHE